MSEQTPENQSNPEQRDATVQGEVATFGAGAKQPASEQAQGAFAASDVPASQSPFDPSQGGQTEDQAQGSNANVGVDPSQGAIPPAETPSPEERREFTQDEVDATYQSDPSLPEPNNGTDTSLPQPSQTSLETEPTGVQAEQPETGTEDPGNATEEAQTESQVPNADTTETPGTQTPGAEA